MPAVHYVLPGIYCRFSSVRMGARDLLILQCGEGRGAKESSPEGSAGLSIVVRPIGLQWLFSLIIFPQGP